MGSCQGDPKIGLVSAPCVTAVRLATVVVLSLDYHW